MISRRLKEIILYVASYSSSTTNDWFAIKKELINTFPPKDRSKFSRRHYSTKKHIINSFDLQIISYWKEITGVELIIDESKIHPKDWIQKPKGWGLQGINEERKRNKKIKEPN